MRPMTREEVRGAIVNLDPAAKRVRLPARFDNVRWPPRTRSDRQDTP